MCYTLPFSVFLWNDCVRRTKCRIAQAVKSDYRSKLENSPRSLESRDRLEEYTVGCLPSETERGVFAEENYIIVVYFYWVLADVVSTCLSTFACTPFVWKTNNPIQVLLYHTILWRCVCPRRIYSNQHWWRLYRQWWRRIPHHSKASYVSFDASYSFPFSVNLDKRFKNAQFKNMEFLEIVWVEVLISCRFFRRHRFATCLCSLFWTISPHSATKPSKPSSTPCSICVEAKTFSCASSELTAIAPSPNGSKSESKAGLSLLPNSLQILAAGDRSELSSSFRCGAIRCLHALPPWSAARNASVEFRREENRAEQGVLWAGRRAVRDLPALFPYPLWLSAWRFLTRKGHQTCVVVCYRKPSRQSPRFHHRVLEEKLHIHHTTEYHREELLSAL